MHGFVDPPAQQNEEWHPKERELNAEIDGTRLSKLRRHQRLFTEDMIDNRTGKVGNCDHPVRGKRYDGQKNESKPPSREGLDAAVGKL